MAENISTKKVGLYLGSNSLGGVVVENNQIISSARYDLTSLSTEAEVDNLNEELKWEALINKTLREIGAQVKDIYVSLAEREFILRSFEMPMMGKKEIEAALKYEIEKYIPFKMEELRWDYSYIKFPKERKVEIFFVGIRESIYKKVSVLFSRLGLNAILVEPCSLSIVKVLKLSKQFSKIKNFILLDFSESEAYLVFFYYDYPVFSRHFPVIKRNDSIDLEKFMEPVHFSYQYFKREFKAYEPEQFIVLANSTEEKLLTLLEDEFPKKVTQFSSFSLDFLGKESLCVENIKAFGVTSREYSSYKFNPLLMNAADHLTHTAAKKETSLRGVWFYSLIWGITILVLAFLFTKNRLYREKAILSQEESKLVKPSPIESLSWEEIDTAIKDKEAEAGSLEGIGSFGRVYPFLNKIAGLLTEGLWLESLKLSVGGGGGKYSCLLEGKVFLNDSYRERASVNQFISNLQKDEAVKSFFSNVNPNSMERKKQDDAMVTFFSIKLE